MLVKESKTLEILPECAPLWFQTGPPSHWPPPRKWSLIVCEPRLGLPFPDKDLLYTGLHSSLHMPSLSFGEAVIWETKLSCLYSHWGAHEAQRSHTSWGHKCSACGTAFKGTCQRLCSRPVKVNCRLRDRNVDEFAKTWLPFYTSNTNCILILVDKVAIDCWRNYLMSSCHSFICLKKSFWGFRALYG